MGVHEKISAIGLKRMSYCIDLALHLGWAPVSLYAHICQSVEIEAVEEGEIGNVFLGLLNEGNQLGELLVLAAATLLDVLELANAEISGMIPQHKIRKLVLMICCPGEYQPITAAQHFDGFSVGCPRSGQNICSLY